MRRTLMVIGALIGVLRAAHADQCACLSTEQQDKALAYLTPGATVLEYCELCATEAPAPLLLQSVQRVALSDTCTILLPNLQRSRPAIDLAYTFVQLDPDVELFTNLATLTGCKHHGTSDSIRRDGTRPIPALTGTATIPAIDGGDAAMPRLLVDSNGDGRAELCRVRGVRTTTGGPVGTVDCADTAPSRLTRWVRAFVPIPPIEVPLGNAAEAAFVDHDGDGRVDFCRIVNGAPVCNLGIGAASASTTTVTGPATAVASTPMRGFADVNGDRRADDCRIIGAGGAASLVCTLALAGGGFGTTRVTTVLPWGGEGDPGWPRWMADVNGDNRADYCRVFMGALWCTQVGGTVNTELGLGRVPVALRTSAVETMAADVNGDRIADLCAVSSRRPLCMLGGIASRGGLAELQPLTGDGPYAWGDINRDGAADVCLVDGRTGTCSAGGFSMWRAGDPDNTGHCARVTLPSGAWSDADCRLPHRFVCGHISDPTRWRLTIAADRWDAGNRACITELGEGWRFTVPDNIDEAGALTAALVQLDAVEDAWINLVDRRSEGAWVRPEVYRAWTGREPADQAGSRTCAMSGSAGWRAELCTSNASFACRSVTGDPAWRVTRGTASWTRGFRTCSTEHGALYRFAMPAGESDHQAIRAAAGNADVWIDLTRFSDGYWDEIDPIYDNFGNGEPDNQRGSEGCVAIGRDGVWSDQACDLRAPVACKRNESSPSWFVAAASDWNGASDSCRAQGGWFDAPTSDADNSSLGAAVSALTWINRSGPPTSNGNTLDKRCIWDGCFVEIVAVLAVTAAVAAALHTHSQPPDYTANPIGSGTCPDHGAADAAEKVELLVVVTQQAVAEMVAEKQDPETVVRERVQALNKTLADSQIARQVHLVGIEYRPWNTSAYNNDAGALLRAANGTTAVVTPDLEARDIRKLRKRYAADLVSVFVPRGLQTSAGATCGIGDDTLGGPGDTKAGYSIVKWDCGALRQNSGFVHEVGHNFGLHHDRYTVANGSAGADALPGYAYGYVDYDGRFYTTMAYATRFLAGGITTNRLLDRFSSPCLKDPVTGRPLGDDRNDDRRALLESWGTVSRYQPPPQKDEL